MRSGDISIIGLKVLSISNVEPNLLSLEYVDENKGLYGLSNVEIVDFTSSNFSKLALF